MYVVTTLIFDSSPFPDVTDYDTQTRASAQCYAIANVNELLYSVRLWERSAARIPSNT